MTDTTLSALADTSPNHDMRPMLFDGVDVARMARQIEAKPTRLTKALFGLHPRGLAHLLRKLWLDGESTAHELAATNGAFERVSREVKEQQFRIWELEERARSITHKLDCVIAAFPKKTAGVLIISEQDMERLEDAYTCTTHDKASSGERWAYKYEGFRVFTARKVAGPFILPTDIFESFKLNLGKAVTLRER